MNIHRFTTIAACACLAALLLPARGFAQDEMATSGYVSGTQKVMSELALEDGRTLRRVFFSVGVMADDPTLPFHLGSQDCLGSYVFAADNSLVDGEGMCDFVSPEGDVWWLTIEVGDDGMIHWTGDGGTGKLAGLEHSGTTVILSEWADGKVIGRWEGTLKKK